MCLRRAGASRKACAASKIRPINRSAVCWLRYGAFSYSRAAKTSIALHSSRRNQDLCVIFDIDSQIISLTVGRNGRWHPRICSMAVVWTFNVPHSGTRRVFSIEDRIWDGQRTSVSATVGRTLGASLGVRRQIRTRGGGFGDDFKVASSKALLGSKCTLCCKGSRQPIEIATNATALRAHERQ